MTNNTQAAANDIATNEVEATFQICQIDNSDCSAPFVVVNGIGTVDGTKDDQGAEGYWIPGEEITSDNLALSIPTG